MARSTPEVCMQLPQWRVALHVHVVMYIYMQKKCCTHTVLPSSVVEEQKQQPIALYRKATFAPRSQGIFCGFYSFIQGYTSILTLNISIYSTRSYMSFKYTIYNYCMVWISTVSLSIHLLCRCMSITFSQCTFTTLTILHLQHSSLCTQVERSRHPQPSTHTHTAPLPLTHCYVCASALPASPLSEGWDFSNDCPLTTLWVVATTTAGAGEEEEEVGVGIVMVVAPCGAATPAVGNPARSFPTVCSTFTLPPIACTWLGPTVVSFTPGGGWMIRAYTGCALPFGEPRPLVLVPPGLAPAVWMTWADEMTLPLAAAACCRAGWEMRMVAWPGLRPCWDSTVRTTWMFCWLPLLPAWLTMIGVPAIRCLALSTLVHHTAFFRELLLGLNFPCVNKACMVARQM